MRQLIYTFFAILTTVIGWNMHHSIFFAVMDFLFWPLVWLKWLLLQQVTLSFIKSCFTNFLS
jgi:hypothetical protein